MNTCFQGPHSLPTEIFRNFFSWSSTRFTWNEIFSHSSATAQRGLNAVLTVGNDCLRNCGALIFSRLEKAYDTTWRHGILRKLKCYGVSEDIISSLESYLFRWTNFSGKSQGSTFQNTHSRKRCSAGRNTKLYTLLPRTHFESYCCPQFFTVFT